MMLKTMIALAAAFRLPMALTVAAGMLLSGATLAQERKTVLVSFTIMADMARQVGCDQLNVVSIVPTGFDDGSDRG